MAIGRRRISDVGAGGGRQRRDGHRAIRRCDRRKNDSGFGPEPDASGASSPLVIEEFTLSADNQRLLIFTNTERVWRSNTRGDYWVFLEESAKLRKLGGDAKPSTLMFAKFSPDATRVGYVRENNIYVKPI